ncbi:MAG: hypothetical protein ABJ242_02550 [Marinomonas sp.]
MELHLPDGTVMELNSLDELAAALPAQETVPEGGVIELKESPKHSLRAERDDAYWIVTAKRRGWWFRQTLTTGDWIDPATRKKRPFWVLRGSLSDAKVKATFFEYFEGRKFSQPIKGD